MNNNYYLYYDEAEQRFTLLMWDGNESMGGLGHNINFDLYFTNTQANGRIGRGLGGGFGSQNVLVERFMANETFKALYEQKLKEIYPQVFQSGALAQDVERFSTLIHSVNDERNLVELSAYDQAVKDMLDFINQRMEYLDTTELLG
jgi:spore coat protein CotH